MNETESPPSRAAWIEIILSEEDSLENDVAAFTGGVDGNIFGSSFGNFAKRSPPSRAAWIEILHSALPGAPCSSPPSRAAWIEIGRGIVEWDAVEVAAFTGGVDGNITTEILCREGGLVAAFTGGVDGNSRCRCDVVSNHGRRFHGRRGLKYRCRRL